MKKKMKFDAIKLDTYPKTTISVFEQVSPLSRGREIKKVYTDKHGHPLQAEDVWTVPQIEAMGINPKHRILEILIYAISEENYGRIQMNRKK
jgi:hypothetical protein